MNTTQLKKFAQEARTKLIGAVSAKLDEVLTQDSATLRAKAPIIESLRTQLNKTGREALVDKIAYTWFNRLVALRYMDANEFQPLGINIVSPANSNAEGAPQILNDVQAGIFPSDLSLNQTYINSVLNGEVPTSNPDNTAYREILIAVCNHLHHIFPFLFEHIDDYTELLLPNDLTSPFSIVADVVRGMPAEDCTEVEIIGWLYQFYISEKKDEVFAAKGKVEKEDIPAATQLFTPRWIVEYMVQNTVGKLWLQNNPQSQLQQHMPYYIENAEEANNAEYLKIKSVEEIKLLDQACGSGHILVYAFELFAKIYEEQGYSTSEIPSKIIENNLYGFEIDERASQLAAFAITMKARAYHRRFFRNTHVPHILCYQDVDYTTSEVSELVEQYKIKEAEAFDSDMELLAQATNLGSLIQPQTSLETLLQTQKQVEQAMQTTNMFEKQELQKLNTALEQLMLLKRKYHCVVDNPPYMGGGNMNVSLSAYVRSSYPNSKADLMACFMEAGVAALEPMGYLGMINQHSWMFLNSYEKLREHLIDAIHIDTLLHLGARTFPEIGGEVVQNASFTLVNKRSKRIGTYIRLVDLENTILKMEHTLEAIQNPNCGWFYNANQKDFKKIPGRNIGYWLSERMMELFEETSLLNYVITREGMATANNDRFLRSWHEVGLSNFKIEKWFPYSKGGDFRRWYGNNYFVVDWADNGYSIINNIDIKTNRVRSHNYNGDFAFKKGFTWSSLSSGNFSCRINNEEFLFDSKGAKGFANTNDSILPIIAFLNSNVTQLFLNLLSPTLDYKVGDIIQVPYLIRLENYSVNKISQDNISISRQEWDSRETSWDFLQNELIRIKGELDNFEPAEGEVVDLANSNLIELAVQTYCDYWQEQFFTLHQNEEELNRQFIDIYGLQDELTSDVPLEDITILKDETFVENGELIFREDEIVIQLLSYAVGCLFGRYSLDKEGLVLANAGETLADYVERVGKSQTELKLVPDADNVIPILDEEWFDDDIVASIHQFVATVWGEDELQTNIQYIEDVLGKDLRKFFARDFYKDHVKRYKKRPIYWMFSSPKGHFNVLIYMHRYTPDTLNLILNSYLRPFMKKLQNNIDHQKDIIITGTAAEQARARKREERLQDILSDCTKYEYDILYPLASERIAIDLDDGVLVNYNKFGNAIAPLTGVNDTKTKQKVKGFDWIDASTIK